MATRQETIEREICILEGSKQLWAGQMSSRDGKKLVQAANAIQKINRKIVLKQMQLVELESNKRWSVIYFYEGRWRLLGSNFIFKDSAGKVAASLNERGLLTQIHDSKFIDRMGMPAQDGTWKYCA